MTDVIIMAGWDGERVQAISIGHTGAGVETLEEARSTYEAPCVCELGISCR